MVAVVFMEAFEPSLDSLLSLPLPIQTPNLPQSPLYLQGVTNLIFVALARMKTRESQATLWSKNFLGLTGYILLVLPSHHIPLVCPQEVLSSWVYWSKNLTTQLLLMF